MSPGMRPAGLIFLYNETVTGPAGEFNPGLNPCFRKSTPDCWSPVPVPVKLIMRRGAADMMKEGLQMMNPEWNTLDALPLLDRAVAFAAVKHSGQHRKGTNLPYITHVVEAMEIVSRMTEDEELRAAAVLHDTLEDTDTTKEELVRCFGQRVADLVAAESENKRVNRPAEETWWTRKQETIHHLEEAIRKSGCLPWGISCPMPVPCTGIIW